jgi:hypothetical protein
VSEIKRVAWVEYLFTPSELAERLRLAPGQLKACYIESKAGEVTGVRVCVETAREDAP